MTRWANGEADVERLLNTGELERVRGAEANGAPWIERAEKIVVAAEGVEFPPSKYALSYDAARTACTGLLAQQGLRPTTSGGHYAVEVAVRSQFGDGFRSFGAMRRRRHEVEYPAFATGDDVDEVEAADAVDDARQIVAAAGRLMDHLGLF